MLHKITSSKFADDTKITTECLYDLRNDLNRLHGLTSENKMVFNADETKLIWVSLKKTRCKGTTHETLTKQTENGVKLSLGSNTKLVTAKSELLHTIEIDTNCFPNKV